MDDKIVRHVLIGKFSPEMTSEKFAEFLAAFRELTTKIEGIISFEYGENNSPEGLNQGMTHVIVLTFIDAAARNAYLIHPEHVRFAKWFGGLGIMEALLVVDYTPQSK